MLEEELKDSRPAADGQLEESAFTIRTTACVPGQINPAIQQHAHLRDPSRRDHLLHQAGPVRCRSGRVSPGLQQTVKGGLEWDGQRQNAAAVCSQVA